MAPPPDAVASRASSLRNLQQDFQRHLLGEPSQIEAAIVDAPPLPVAERLGIYRNAYRVRLIEALDDTYPILHAVLGDEVFCALGEEFVAAHPSVHRSIRWYGRELAEFLGQCAPYAEQPILAELALLEWTLAEVFDAADAESLPRSALSAIDASAWSDLRFEFHPSLRRLRTLLEHRRGVAGHEPRGSAARPSVRGTARALALWRQNLQNYFRSHGRG